MRFSIFIDYTSMYISTWSMNREMEVTEIEDKVCNNLFLLEDYLKKYVGESRIELVNKTAYILDGSNFGNPEAKLNSKGIKTIKVKVTEEEFEESNLEGKVDYGYEIKNKVIKTIEKISKNMSQDKLDKIESKLDKLGIQIKQNNIVEESIDDSNEYGNLQKDVADTLESANIEGIIVVSNNSEFIQLYKLTKSKNKVYWAIVNESKDAKLITNNDRCFNINEISKKAKKLKTPIQKEIAVDILKNEAVTETHKVDTIIDVKSEKNINEAAQNLDLIEMMNKEIINSNIGNIEVHIEEKIEENTVENRRIELYENGKLLETYLLDKKNMYIGKSNEARKKIKDIDLYQLKDSSNICENYGNIYLVGKKVILSLDPKCNSNAVYKSKIIKPGKQVQLINDEVVLLENKNRVELVYKK